MFKVRDNISLNILEDFGYRQITKPYSNDYYKIKDNYFIVINNTTAYIRAYKGKISTNYELFNSYQEIRIKTQYIKDLISLNIIEKKHLKK